VRNNPLKFFDPFGLKDMSQAYFGIFVGQIQNNSPYNIPVYSTDGAFDFVPPGGSSDLKVDWDSYLTPCGECINIPGTGSMLPLNIDELGNPERHFLHFLNELGFPYGQREGDRRWDCQ